MHCDYVTCSVHLLDILQLLMCKITAYSNVSMFAVFSDYFISSLNANFSLFLADRYNATFGYGYRHNMSSVVVCLSSVPSIWGLKVGWGGFRA